MPRTTRAIAPSTSSARSILAIGTSRCLGRGASSSWIRPQTLSKIFLASWPAASPTPRPMGVKALFIATRRRPAADQEREQHGGAEHDRGGVLAHLGDDLLAALLGALRRRAL